jgi:hypothetical protein
MCIKCVELTLLTVKSIHTFIISYHWKNMTESESLLIQGYSLHKVDVAEQAATLLRLDGDISDLTSYVKIVLEELIESPRSRFFAFSNDTEIVPRALHAIANRGDWVVQSNIIAQKLYSAERELQDRLRHFTDIRIGGLLQVHVTHNSIPKIVIVKIDNSDFLDVENLNLKSGLPASKKNRIQKAAIVSFKPDGSVDELLLSDTKSTITEYWYLRFLFATQLTSSETNTKNAFNAIDGLLARKVKPVSSIDYWFLRNDIVNHFRNEDSLAFDDLVEKVENHTPESEAFEAVFDDFVAEFRTLPTSSTKQFDTQFDIESSAIKARIIKKVILDENVELRINGEVDNLKGKIEAQIDAKGKFIKIYSDRGYEEFKAGNAE